MNKIFYENLNKVNSEFLSDYIKILKNIFKNDKFIMGNNLSKFEYNFKKFNNSRYCLGVNSGLDALLLALKSLNLEKNSEVILPSNCYIAAVFAVINAGLKPVFVEPNINTYNIDPDLISKKINSNTKAILIVHLYGKPCDMDKILTICKKKNLFLIEDCAQSHGAKYKNQITGSFGEFGCFSFYPTKNLGGIGDGGAITLKKKFYFNKLLKLRNYGSTTKNNHELVGLNSRLDEIQAAFLNLKLKKLNKINSHKKKLAKIYLNNLSDKFIKPQVNNYSDNVYHIFPIRFEERKKLIKYLDKNKISTLIHYPIPPYLQKYNKDKLKEKYPISNEIHNTILSLPISTIHNERDILKITKIMNKF